mmetsp:Transcript_20783/g.45052  ORF Transcript_20783/g.45052 Transcript_20783/m.45052 type:complete len:516 (-) Transcript_20783:49-1596(-)
MRWPAIRANRLQQQQQQHQQQQQQPQQQQIRCRPLLSVPHKPWKSGLLVQSLLLLSVLSSTLAANEATPQHRRKEESAAVLLPHHSFTQPMEYSSLLEDWSLSGASLFERERLMMHPGVPNLAGFAFNSGRLLTSLWKQSMALVFSGGREPTEGQSMAFWYVQENISYSYKESTVIKAPSWREGLDQLGMTFHGMKPRFDGFGVIFLTKGASGKPTVKVVLNDGTKDVPDTIAEVDTVDFRNMPDPVLFNLRVKANEMVGEMTIPTKQEATQIFQVPLATRMKSGGFVGLTAWSGAAPMPDLVSVQRFEILNTDETVTGEELRDVSAQIQEAYREMLTDEHRHFLDQKSQTDHLVRLTSLVSDHLSTSKRAEESLAMQIQALSGRVHRLGESCRELRKETDLLLGQHDQGGGGLGSLKEQIQGLRHIFNKEGAHAQKKLDAVAKNIQQVKSRHESMPENSQRMSAIAEQGLILEQTVSSRGTQMTGMMIVLVVSIVGIGLMMWRRMNYYEKRNFL